MTDKELLTAREMASRFRIALRTVWSLTARGALPAPLRWGRVVRWRVADVEKFIDRQESRSTFPA
jgi:excisionase family DNA binding protein